MKLSLLVISLILCFCGIDYYNLGDPIRDGKFRYILFACCPILFFYLKERLSWPPAFIGALALASFTAHNYMSYAALPLLLILAALIFSCFVVEFESHVFGNVLIYCGLAQAALAIYQALYLKWYAVGLFGNETLLGPFLVCALAPALWWRRWVISSVLLLGVALTKSSMTYGAAAVLGLLYIQHLYGSRAFLLASLGSFVLVLLAYFSLSSHYVFSLNGRAFIWKFGLIAFKESPLFGSGIGSWAGYHLPKHAKDILVEYRWHLPWQLHSDWFQFAVEYGITGFLVLAYALIKFILSFRPTWHHAICVVLLVNALASFPFAIMPLAVVFIVSWAYSNKEEKTYGNKIRAFGNLRGNR